MPSMIWCARRNYLVDLTIDQVEKRIEARRDEMFVQFDVPPQFTRRGTGMTPVKLRRRCHHVDRAVRQGLYPRSIGGSPAGQAPCPGHSKEQHR